VSETDTPVCHVTSAGGAALPARRAVDLHESADQADVIWPTASWALGRRFDDPYRTHEIVPLLAQSGGAVALLIPP
jgi:hypothetical protein